MHVERVVEVKVIVKSELALTVAVKWLDNKVRSGIVGNEMT